MLAAALLAAAALAAAEPVDHEVIGRIKLEGFQASELMETLAFLTDVHGPRLTNSPGYRAAAEWSRERLAGWGLASARLEPWGDFGRGWSAEHFSVVMKQPRYMRLIAYPKAWTPSTAGVVAGNPVLVEIRSPEDFGKHRGRLRGAIVLNGKPETPEPSFEPSARRLDEQALDGRQAAIDPGKPRGLFDESEEWRKEEERRNEIRSFFRQEGIAVLVEPSARRDGVVRVTRGGPYDPKAPETFPAFVMAREHYNRIARLLERSQPVELEVELRSRFHDEDTTGYNVIAELPGADPELRDEVVMLGAHLDSWHAGTGATDNAAGCAVVMEAVRILKAIGVQPRRTIRVALWGGEEQGYLGSIGYVTRNFGDPRTLALNPDHEKLSAYFNLDNGTGRIRGVHLQGNELVRPIFDAYLEPFRYLGATTLSARNTSGTDHMVFDAVGLPGFQFIQDPIAYGTRTHHTHLDLYDHVVEEDLKQAAVIMASFVYHTAQRDERLPRKPLPRPSSTAPERPR